MLDLVECAVVAHAEEPLVRCSLEHQLFTRFGDVIFRHADGDRTPAMVMIFGERAISIPLRSLQREFAIDDELPDGRMLNLIAQAIDYVDVVRIGDKLPREVIDGGASWSPAQSHRDLARARLRCALIGWFEPDETSTQQADIQAMEHLKDDPRLRDRVAAASAEAAQALGLADPSVVTGLLEELTDELSYIEALRERLLLRAQVLVENLAALATGLQGDASHFETLTQVQRLVGNGVKQIASRFEEVDAQSGEVLVALQDAQGHRSFLRANRNWLYRNQRAWEPTFKAWANAPRQLDDVAWLIIRRTYRFLAPRYMAVQDWQLTNTLRRPRKSKTVASGMRW